MKVVLKRIEKPDRHCDGCIFWDKYNCSLVNDDRYNDIKCYDEETGTDYIFVFDKIIEDKEQ